MLKRLLPVGILLLLLASRASAATPLYDLMKKSVEEELSVGGFDKEIIPYLRKLFEEKWKVTDEDVENILKNETFSVCGKEKEEQPLAGILHCVGVTQQIRALAHDERRVRVLGRTLQAVASSYELPISDLPGRTLKLSADLRGILNIWSAGTGSIKVSTNAPVIRTFSADRATFEPLLRQLGDELKKLEDEQQVGAVWHYQYGVRLVLNQRAPRFPAPVRDSQGYPGFERQYVFQPWPDVEAKLTAIWDEIKNDTFTPPLSQKETVYFTFPEDLVEETLPENMIIWARVDGNPNDGNPYGDVGLQWQVPLEPVMPSLMKYGADEAILGGTYPPEPVSESGLREPIDGRGLCTNPIAERGYLCRPFEVAPEGERCPQDGLQLDPAAINLISCTMTGTIRTTAAGADACREVKWKNDEQFDPNTQCKVAFRCAQNCAPGGNASARTDVKGADGVISICVSERTEFANTYLFYHELAHAYQECNQPVGHNPYNDPDGALLSKEERAGICCRNEGEAYRAQCDMMERDGVFSDANGNPIVGPDGTPFNAETCAEAFTDYACTSQQELTGCYTSQTYSQEFINSLITAAGNNPKNVPALCSEAIDPAKMDPRVAQLKEAIEARDDVCAPGQVNLYKNRIGNNLCYIGQCVEMSVELHRIAAGQSPVTVGDQTAPWDNPKSGTPLGNILMNPPLMPTHLPSYRPLQFMREMETALCQLQGLPPLTPPILCAIDARRQLGTGRQFGLETIFGVARQETEQQASTEDLLGLSHAMGTRMGTQLYGDYMREASRSFAGVIDMANTLLKEMDKIDFPTEMCPVGPGMPTPPSSN
jgi:hypothetical protein